MEMIKDNMTAVDFIIQRLAKNGILHSSDIAEANELFKKQIIKAVYDSMGTNFDPNMGRAELYYNETYKTK
jgi:hypothetical protein